jgi:hypothetical protein
VWRPIAIVRAFDSRVLKDNGAVARRLLDQKMRPPSGGGVTRQLFRERMRLYVHLEAAIVARENAEMSLRFLRMKAKNGCEWWQANAEGHMAHRTLDVGS